MQLRSRRRRPCSSHPKIIRFIYAGPERSAARRRFSPRRVPASRRRVTLIGKSGITTATADRRSRLLHTRGGIPAPLSRDPRVAPGRRFYTPLHALPPRRHPSR